MARSKLLFNVRVKKFSNVILNQEHIELLEKGFNYSPLESVKDIEKLTADLQQQTLIN